MGVSKRSTRAVIAGTVAVAAVVALGHADAAGGERAKKGTTLRMSVGAGGVQANGGSNAVAVSGNCNVVAFATAASNLVPNDTHKYTDVVARVRSQQKAVLVSKAPGGVRANGHSRPAALSADGQLVAYDSDATNLVAGDDNGWRDVFVRDLSKKRSELISVATDGGPANAESSLPSISGDGRYVAFPSAASDLTDEPEWNDIDVFVRDRQTQTTELISKAADGGAADNGSGPPRMSANGRYVLFDSLASNLVVGQEDDDWNDVFRYDRETGETIEVSLGEDNAVIDDAPVGADDISKNGRYVTMTTYSDKMIDGLVTPDANVYWRDVETGEVRIASVSSAGELGDSFAFYSSISNDGNVVTFDSQSNDLVPGDQNSMVDVYVHYMDSGVTKRATVSSTGRGARGGGAAGQMGSSGRCVGFSSGDRLVPNDTNGLVDVYLRVFGSPPAVAGR